MNQRMTPLQRYFAESYPVLYGALQREKTPEEAARTEGSREEIRMFRPEVWEKVMALRERIKAKAELLYPPGEDGLVNPPPPRPRARHWKDYRDLDE